MNDEAKIESQMDALRGIDTNTRQRKPSDRFTDRRSNYPVRKTAPVEVKKDTMSKNERMKNIMQKMSAAQLRGVIEKSGGNCDEIFLSNYEVTKFL